MHQSLAGCSPPSGWPWWPVLCQKIRCFPGFFSPKVKCPQMILKWNSIEIARRNATRATCKMGHWHDHGPGKISRSLYLGFVGCTTGGMGFESQGILKWTCWWSYMRNIIGIDSHVFILCICTYIYVQYTLVQSLVSGLQISWGFMLPSWFPEMIVPARGSVG